MNIFFFQQDRATANEYSQAASNDLSINKGRSSLPTQGEATDYFEELSLQGQQYVL